MRTLSEGIESASLQPIVQRLIRAAEDAAAKIQGLRSVLEEMPEPLQLKFTAVLKAYTAATVEETAALMALGEYGERVLAATILLELADKGERLAAN